MLTAQQDLIVCEVDISISIQVSERVHAGICGLLAVVCRAQQLLIASFVTRHCPSLRLVVSPLALNTLT